MATAGSVDDGKSTLIGRLLHDTRSILDDQLDAVQVTSQERGDGRLDLALLTDGLRAEREQGITIDVAYRFFTTPRRSFILADTPGHVRYTRNMVTGASTADVAIVLDRRPPRRRRAVQAPRVHRLAAGRAAHRRVRQQDGPDRLGPRRVRGDRADFAAFGRRVGLPDVAAVPISALNGDNVVERSDAAPWYDGPPLLEYLEGVDVAADRRVLGAAPACRCSGWCARTTTPTTTTAATPARSPAACCGRATRSWSLPQRRTLAGGAHRHASTARSRRRSRRCR